MDQNELRELLRAGIEAAKNNNKIIARDYLRQVIEVEPTNEAAWLWMAQASDTAEDRRRCLLRVLEINPNNENARTALQRLPSAASEQAGSQATTSHFRNPPSRPQRVSASQKSADQERDWFQPVKRRQGPEELWAADRPPRNENWWIMAVMAAVALGIIAIAVILLLNQQEDNDNNVGATQEAQANTQTAQAIIQLSALPPTITNTPFPTVDPTLLARPTQLPPTLLPTSTPEPRPTATRTPAPNPPSVYSLIFAGNSNPVGPYELFTITADGTNLNPISVIMPSLERPEGLDLPPAVAIDEPTADPESATEGTESEGPELQVEETPEPVTLNATDLLDPVYSPDGQQIIFTGQYGEAQELFIVDASGGTARQITRLGGTETRDAAWSPNGQWILFASNAGEYSDLYLVPADGSSDPQRLTNNNAHNRQPAWSPDSRYFAFSSDMSAVGNFEIYVRALQGETLCQMTDAAGSSFSPNWSPDGTRIIFISNRDQDNDVYIMRADGSDERLITTSDNGWQDRDPAWSPDGQWIVFSSTRVETGTSANPTSKLWLTTSNGSVWLPITRGEGNDLSAAWLPMAGLTPPADLDFSCAAG